MVLHFRVILPVGDIDAAAAFYAALLDIPGERVSAGRHLLVVHRLQAPIIGSRF